MNSKGQRNKANCVPDFDPLSRYRQIARGIYDWSGLPDDVPEGFIEEALFEFGCVGAKKCAGTVGIVITPAWPVTRGIYGNPIKWLPTAVYNAEFIPDLLVESETPVLWIGEAPAARAEIYGNILKNALVSLRQNVVALRQPIALESDIAATANALVLGSEIDEGAQYIPVLDASKLGVNVIDLKAHDFTGSLISTANAMDNEILSIIGVKNTGTEKASGITSEETTSLHQELSLLSDVGLRLRKQWCERINAKLGTGFNVELADSYQIEEVNENDSSAGGKDNGNENEM